MQNMELLFILRQLTNTYVSSNLHLSVQKLQTVQILDWELKGMA